ncbi:MAG: Methyltransferase type 11 [Parcubacteria group bacterium GW2011_GWC2_39_14]|nr:MAG: Methyltransferase type 11 [Parcubacteria group bacterium GW2011_GWC2_39_14]KKR54619.1 MAG: Methyltransferase type 11 [Parcubacteria group bacterium GW2011_GWA2_40_23]
MQEVYNKFLSAGFAAFNESNARYLISQYGYNYKKFLPSNKSARILEIGAGMGRFLQYLGEAGYENFLGVDISPESIQYCEEKGIKKVQLIKSIDDFLIGSGNFDLIFMNDVIEHLPQDETLETLHRLYERLNSGGRLIIKTGNLSSLIGPRIRFGDFTHYQGFTEYSLAQVIQIAGFSVFQVYPFKVPRNRIRRIIRAGLQKIVHGLWKLVYFLEFTYPPKIVDEIIFIVAQK